MKYSNLYILIGMTLFYVLFAFTPMFHTYGVKLFANDFSREGVTEWFYFTAVTNLFLIAIGLFFSDHPNKFKSMVGLAVAADGFLTIVGFLIFGFYGPDYIQKVINAIPLSYIFYAYFAYGRLR